MSPNEASLPPAHAPYGPSAADAFDDVIALGQQARQQLDRLMATLAQLEDFLEAADRQQRLGGGRHEAKPS